MKLDVMDQASIEEAVSQIKHLDILVSNAGAMYASSFPDMSIAEAKKLFDLNVWSYLAVTQAFLPLILQSKGLIFNHTSCSSACTVPFCGTYNASKAAMATFSDTQPLELTAFGARVVDIKSGAVLFNINDAERAVLPANSIYAPAKEAVEKALATEDIVKGGMDQEVWAKAVVADLLKANPPPIIWRGSNAWLVWLGTMVPFGWMDGTIKKMTGVDVVERKLRG
ncbi:NAD(P)-binding protein [Tothia fuscella]|uniref:NAD(P)-binding protein n=1 Tax=Tothia fuscella TaxID=1048955 RepID=A0A9P4NWJ6_9PEZI|nr:NAD(P)-binding protein [Tothia fuscella]